MGGNLFIGIGKSINLFGPAHETGLANFDKKKGLSE
jgi:hypothetical protein